MHLSGVKDRQIRRESLGTSKNPGGVFYTSRLVLRLLYVFRVCLFVCLSVRPHLSRAQYITSYVTMQLQCIAAFGGLQAKLQQMKVVLCCLDGENVVGSRKDPGFVAYSY